MRTWAVEHTLIISFAAPGGGTILLNSPFLSRGVGTNNVFLAWRSKENTTYSRTQIPRSMSCHTAPQRLHDFTKPFILTLKIWDRQYFCLLYISKSIFLHPPTNNTYSHDNSYNFLFVCEHFILVYNLLFLRDIIGLVYKSKTSSNSAFGIIFEIVLHEH